MTNKKLIMLVLLIVGVGLYGYLMATPETTTPEQEEQQLRQDLQLIAESNKSEFVLDEPINIILRIRNVGLKPISIIRPEHYNHHELRSRFLYERSCWHLYGYITTSNGKEKVIEPTIMPAKMREFPWATRDDFIQLKPKQEVTIKTCLDKWPSDCWENGYWHFSYTTDEGKWNLSVLEACFSDVGEYTLKFILESSIDKYSEFLGYGEGKSSGKGISGIETLTKEIEVDDAWTGKISSNELKIKVVQGNK